MSAAKLNIDLIIQLRAVKIKINISTLIKVFNEVKNAPMKLPAKLNRMPTMNIINQVIITNKGFFLKK